MLLLPLLIADIADPDDRAFIIDLYKKAHKRIYRIARRYSNTASDTDDIVSETAIVLMKKVSYLRELDNRVLYSYVYGIAKHVGMDNRRKALRNRTVDTELDEIPSHDHSVEPDSYILERVTIDVLADAISKLSETDQFLLEAKYFLEFSDHEIARNLGIKTASVRSKLSRARKALYRVLKEDH